MKQKELIALTTDETKALFATGYHVHNLQEKLVKTVNDSYYAIGTALSQLNRKDMYKNAIVTRLIDSFEKKYNCFLTHADYLDENQIVIELCYGDIYRTKFIYNDDNNIIVLHKLFNDKNNVIRNTQLEFGLTLLDIKNNINSYGGKIRVNPAKKLIYGNEFRFMLLSEKA